MAILSLTISALFDNIWHLVERFDGASCAPHLSQELLMIKSTKSKKMVLVTCSAPTILWEDVCKCWCWLWHFWSELGISTKPILQFVFAHDTRLHDGQRHMGYMVWYFEQSYAQKCGWEGILHNLSSTNSNTSLQPLALTGTMYVFQKLSQCHQWVLPCLSHPLQQSESSQDKFAPMQNGFENLCWLSPTWTNLTKACTYILYIIYIWIYIYIYMCMCMCMYMYMYMCMCVCVYVCMCVCVYVCMCVCVYVYVYIYIYVCMYVCMYIYIYIYNMLLCFTIFAGFPHIFRASGILGHLKEFGYE